MKNFIRKGLYNFKKKLPNDIGIHTFDIVNKSIKYTKNGVVMSNKEMLIRGCHWYIGKILKDKNEREGMIYNDDFIIASLAYLFGLTGDITIEIGAGISEIVNGSEDVEGFMSTKEIRDYIGQLAKKHFPNDYKRLNIVDIEEDNIKLFSNLREKGLVALDIDFGDLELDVYNFDAYDIAKYLYSAAKKNKGLLKMFGNIKPDGVERTESNFPEYYALVEVSFRLYDFLKNPEIVQGGISRQRKYDKIILMILDDDLSNYPELKGLQDFCKLVLKNKKIIDGAVTDLGFSSVGLDMKKYGRDIGKIKLKNKIRLKKINLTTAISMAILTAIGGGILTKNYIENKQKVEIENVIDKILRDNLADYDIPINLGDKILYTRSIDNKLNAVKYKLFSFAKDFKIRYDIDDQWDLTQWAYFVADDLVKKNILQDMGYEKIGKVNKSERFICDFVDDNKIKLVANGINIKPYSQFKKYEKLFEAAILEKDRIIEYNSLGIETVIRVGDYMNKFEKEELGEYIDREGYRYKLAVVRPLPGYSATGISPVFRKKGEYLLCSEPIYDFNGDMENGEYPIKGWTKYSNEKMLELAKDYFSIVNYNRQSN